MNTLLKVHYHHQNKHFYEKFCERNYFGLDFAHKLAFHPIRIMLDEFTEYVFCAGVSRAGYWRQFLAGIIVGVKLRVYFGHVCLV